MTLDPSTYQPEDDFFGPAYIDQDETLEHPIACRYLHGGFEGTDTRFSMYFPPADAWKGRLLTGLGGAAGGDEGGPVAAVLPTSALNGPVMSTVIGACYVQSNQGHLGADMSGIRGDQTIVQHRADAEAARLCKYLAAQLYGSAPHHSYIYGGSGGGNRTLWCMEGAPGVWDGGVPFMFGGSPFSAILNAARVLRPVLDHVVDAMQPGGSGDPYELLDVEQREALAEVYRMGFPRGGEFQLRLPMPEISWPGQAAMRGYALADPTYVDDFWSKAGYAGADPDGAMRRSLMEDKAVVTGVVTIGDLFAAPPEPSGGINVAMLVAFSAGAGADPATPIGLRLSVPEPEVLTGATVTLSTGVATERKLYIMVTAGDILIPAGEGAFIDLTVLDGVREGDEVVVSNREFLAYCHRHRHEQSHDGGLGSAQFTVDDVSMYPQRDGGGLALSWTGRFAGKMILFQHLLDRPCWAGQAVNYERLVRDALGESVDDSFRLYWTENATHVPPLMEGPAATTRAIDYSGLIEQGLLDVVAWVEEGRRPAPSTSYEWTRDARVAMPPTAERRRGIQPVISATANGELRADVAVGEVVRLEAIVGVPDQASSVVLVEWDLDGSGTWAVQEKPTSDRRAVTSRVEHRYDAPGTYFVTVRVTSHRDGLSDDSYGRLVNQARCRVVAS